MNENAKQLWAYLSMKKGTCDNDYYFYEDGTILHHYDRTIGKRDIEEVVGPSDIPEYEKELIVLKCESECNQEVVTKIKRFLNVK